MIDLCNKSSSNFLYKFEGNSEIDAETLALVLSNTVQSLQHISAKESPEAFVKLQVKSLEAGSFVIDLMAIVSFMPSLLHGEYSLAKNIIDIFIDSCEMKQFLQGQEAKQINQGTITNYHGDNRTYHISSVNIFTGDSTIDENLTEIFHALNQDRSKKALLLRHDATDKLRIEQTEYETMSKPVIPHKHKNIKTKAQEVITDLFIKKVDFIGNSQWEFVYNKNINAPILDEAWLASVKKGNVMLIAGVSLKVKLKIEVDYDENLNPVKDRYSILEVLEVIYPEEHPTLFKT